MPAAAVPVPSLRMNPAALGPAPVQAPVQIQNQVENDLLISLKDSDHLTSCNSVILLLGCRDLALTAQSLI